MSQTRLPDSQESEYVAFLAIDWADQKHVWKMQVSGSTRIETGELEQKPEAVEVWAGQLAQRFHGLIAVCVEQRRGALVYQLLKYPHLVIYPVHPATAARFRQALHPSGNKNDVLDADVLLALLLHHRQHLRRLQPDTPETRCLQGLVELRRCLVDEKTRQKNRLTDRLKIYFPQALEWFDLDTALAGEALRRWPSLPQLQAHHAGTLTQFFRQHHCRLAEEKLQERIRQIQTAVPATTDRAVVETGIAAVRAGVDLMEALQRHISSLDEQIAAAAAVHPDAFIFGSFPGAGPVLMPRLLVAFGSLPQRYANADEVRCYSGIAPITESSGKTSWTHFRWQCPKFLRQTFHEYALRSLPHSVWARTCYQAQRDKGKGHHAAVRVVAYKWIAILFRCWKNRVVYDEQIHLESLRKRKSPYVPVLAPLIDVTQVRWQSVAGFQKLTTDFS
jgi:transposase